MELRQIYDRLEELSKVVSPSEEELFERVNLCIQVYNTRRDRITDDEIAKTRVFLSSDLYSMIAVCYQPALDYLIHTDLELHKAESKTFREEYEKASKEFSKSQAIDIARKYQKENEEYLTAYKNFNVAKNIVNAYDKTMKMGSQVLNSMARRARES